MTTAPPSPAPGTPIGNYEVIDRIAVGGMAEVFRARALQSGGDERIVVLKRMLPSVAAESDGPAMFQEEARLGARVQHPNVVKLLDHVDADGQPYLVFEYVPGCDLWRLSRWILRQGERMDVQIALHITRRLLSGLQAVHDATDEHGAPMGIIHQDVSPSNLLLSIHGDVKLSDFGIARSKLRNARLSVSSRAKGKLGYLAPEQVTGGATGPQTDVFAAGVLCAELLMGRPLFSGGSELAILLAIRDANIRPFLDVPLPEDLKQVVARALARQPEERLPSARSFANVLGRFIQRSRAELRTELAHLVQRASGMENENQLTPSVDLDDLDTADLQQNATPITADLPQQVYMVTRASGNNRSYSFAQLVEAITTGRVGPDDRVSIDGAPPEPIHEHSSLARYLPMSTQTPITQDARVAREPDIRRNMAASGIVTAFAETALRRETGLWLCQHGGVRKEIYVQDGKPQYVSSNIASEMLGEFLVARGVLSRGELDMALAVLPRFEGRLGDTLVGLGLVEPIDLFQHIATQVREKLLDLFLWRSGTAEFYRGVAPPPSGFPLDLDPWAILDEGVERRLRAGLEEARFAQHMASAVQRVRQLPTFASEGELPPNIRALLTLTADAMPLADIVDAFEQNEDFRRGYRTVLVALQLEIVRWV